MALYKDCMSDLVDISIAVNDLNKLGSYYGSGISINVTGTGICIVAMATMM